MSTVKVRVSEQDFDIQQEIKQLRSDIKAIGAVCSFIGYVRDYGDLEGIVGLQLEHYPGMTEKSLIEIAEDACQRWILSGVTIVHRIGLLKPADQIVLVCCASSHRRDAFAACEFLMDFLKVKAPFWKKEINDHGSHWVEAKVSDENDAKRW